MPDSPSSTANTADVGLIGLAVMGQNLALNMADHGSVVAVYNRTTATMERFVAQNPAGVFGDLGGGLVGEPTLEGFVKAIKRPRRIVILVKAGWATDKVIEGLVPLLEEGDCIIDGGNAHWEDTIRREKELTEKGLLFVGSGVSGGEEGARFGPSLMPGGKKESWELIEPIFTAIAAKVDPGTGKPIEGAERGKPVTGGEPCAAYIGPDGAGHFVKMVHNGIEYGDMQMICEAYHLMRAMGGMSPAECGEVFAKWNTGDLDSFLIEITADILGFGDPRTGEPFVDVVLDAAGQKGTGKWTSVAALDYGAPTPTIAEAVFARFMSAIKDERVAAREKLSGPGHDAAERVRDEMFGSKEAFVDAVGSALYCAKVCSYAQGFQLMASAAKEHGWELDYGAIAGIFRGGCIIRARFLQKITDAYARDADLVNLLVDPYFAGEIEKGSEAWRKTVAAASMGGVPVPAFGSALAYFDSYRHSTLPANLLQAQRDYFGAHTYERVDDERGKFFHIDWLHPERPEIEA
ncbi:MAG: decarboxylating NADP(+)-dependent phosphogluconate dehydrogenase [Planctomycetota bacterium]